MDRDIGGSPEASRRHLGVAWICQSKATAELSRGSEVSTRGKKSPRAAGAPRAAELWLDGGQERSVTGNILFAQALECDLDALVVELLVIAAELIATVRPAIEELTNDTDRRVWFSLKQSSASNIDSAVKIKIVDVVVKLPNQQPWNRLVANPQHLSSRTDRRYVLVTPTNFVIKAAGTQQ